MFYTLWVYLMVVNRITSGKCRLPQHFFVPMFLMVNTIWLSWVFFRNIMIELSWIEVILTRRIVRFESSFPRCWFFLQPKFDYSLFIVWQRLQGPFYVIIFLIIKISSFFLKSWSPFCIGRSLFHFFVLNWKCWLKKKQLQNDTVVFFARCELNKRIHWNSQN